GFYYAIPYLFSIGFTLIKIQLTPILSRIAGSRKDDIFKVGKGTVLKVIKLNLGKIGLCQFLERFYRFRPLHRKLANIGCSIRYFCIKGIMIGNPFKILDRKSVV